MNYPSNLLYTKDHEWILISGDQATVGITDFAQSQLGDIVYVDIDSVGNDVAAEEVFGTIEAVKTVADLFMPLAGTVLELNEELSNSPELVNSDPHGDGWLIKIKLSNPEDAAHLMNSEAYTAYLGGLK